eukprot:m.93688 g.93688  ORF g.93688 m.93688 type:complete len:226 (-) comp13406_c0_seq3:1049-1726(-)
MDIDQLELEELRRQVRMEEAKQAALREKLKLQARLEEMRKSTMQMESLLKEDAGQCKEISPAISINTVKPSAIQNPATIITKPAPPTAIFLNEHGQKRITVNIFNGSILLHFREYYKAENNEMKPGNKGITINLREWHALKKSVEDVNMCFKQGVEGKYELGRKRYICVNQFRNKLSADIREFYKDGAGALKPGKKGLFLSSYQWNKFVTQINAVENGIDHLEEG